MNRQLWHLMFLMLLSCLTLSWGCGKGEYDRRLDSRVSELRVVATDADEGEDADATDEGGNPGDEDDQDPSDEDEDVEDEDIEDEEDLDE